MRNGNRFGKRCAYVDVPNAVVNIVGAGTVAYFGGIPADNLVPLGAFERPDGAGKEAGGDKVEEAGRDDEEELELGTNTTAAITSEET